MITTEHLALRYGVVDPADWVRRMDRIAGLTIDFLLGHAKDFEAAACLFAHLAETRPARDKANLAGDDWDAAVADFAKYPDRLHVRRVRALFPESEA